MRVGLTVATTLFLATALLAAPVAPLRAQVGDTAAPPVDSVVVRPGVPVAPLGATQDTTLPMSPRGAFIRSMILPGWGQSAFGAYTRGGVFFAGWAGNWYMNFRNVVRLESARDRFRTRADQIADAMIAASPNPDSMRAVLDTTDILDAAIREDAAGNALRKLVRAREQQREDWIALTIFWILASGIDGYVTAHLAEFPADVEIAPAPGRGVSVRLEVPLPGRRR